MKYADWVQTFVNGGSKAGLTVATGAAVTKALRDYNTEFGKKFGKTIMIRFGIGWTLAKVLTFRPLGISMKPKSRLQKLTIKAAHTVRVITSM